MEIDQRLLEVETRLLALRDQIESPNGLVRLDTAMLDLIGCMQQLAEWAKEQHVRLLAERVRVRSG